MSRHPAAGPGHVAMAGAGALDVTTADTSLGKGGHRAEFRIEGVFSSLHEQQTTQGGVPAAAGGPLPLGKRSPNTAELAFTGAQGPPSLSFHLPISEP
ncbi:unnamed protein product [Rangifer tarandus platyrhynchus]